MESNRFDRFFANIGLITFSLLVLLGVIVGIEAFYGTYQASKKMPHLVDPISTRFPMPYVMFSGMPNHNGHNSRGYLGPLPDMKEDVIRVFVIGGSTVYYGQPAIPKLLEQKFHKEGFKNVRVYNYGVVSSASNQAIARIVYDVSPYDPDLVLWYNGGNDIYEIASGDPRPGYPYNFLVYERNPYLRMQEDFGEFFWFLLLKSNIGRTFLRPVLEQQLLPLRDLQHQMVREYGSTEELHRAKKELYGKNIVLAEKIAGALGADFAVAYQPLVFSKKYRTDFEEKYYIDYMEGRQKEVFSLTMNHLQKQKAKTPLWDLRAIFNDRKEQVFIDPIHIKQEAKSIVVDELWSRLMSAPHLRRFQEKLGAPAIAQIQN